jgi:hypothetical protein
MKPRFEMQQLRLYDSSRLTMDLRINDQEIVAVSEAKEAEQARVQILETSTGRLKESFEVSSHTINCCDVAVNPDIICLGSDDAKVRICRRGDEINSSHSQRYRCTAEFVCQSEVNDLRYTREGAVIAVRTYQNRHPAGLDLIMLERPDIRSSFDRGHPGTNGKFIHAIDGFEECSSLGAVACSAEHPHTSGFSAMYLDFRREQPCVVDVPVTSLRQGHPQGTMLWPLRCGRSPQVFANLLNEDGRRRGRGIIAMIDFRFPIATSVDSTSVEILRLPDPVDDFRFFGGKIYAACTEGSGPQQRMRILRVDPSRPDDVECLCTVAQAYDAGGRTPREDLKVFSVCQRGFVASYGEHITLGTVADPMRGAETVGMLGQTQFARRGLLVDEVEVGEDVRLKALRFPFGRH